MMFTGFFALASAVLIANAVPVADSVGTIGFTAAPAGEITGLQPLTTKASANLFKVCTDANFSGSCFIFFTGSDGSVSPNCQNFASNLQDNISSIQLLNSGITCTFWIDDGCSGNAFVFPKSAPTNSNLAGSGFNDALSSFKCSLSN